MGKAPALGKKCSWCKEIKPTSEFYRRHGKESGFHYICKKCMKEYYHHRWIHNTDDTRQKHYKKYREWFYRIKDEIFNHYGRKCVCCGEENWEFLTIDHIKGGGTKHRKKLGGGTAFFKWLRDNNFPPEYRILCINCNFSLGRFGYCPHQKRS